MMTTKMTNAEAMLPAENKSAVAAKKPATVLDFLQGSQYKQQLSMALPKALDPERFVRTAINEFRKNEMLQQCSVPSVLGYFLQSAALGLEPATVLGHCYAVPFDNRKTNQREAQFIIGYRGMLALARRSGEVSTMNAHIVYEQDEFELTYGVEESITHKPKLDGDRGKMIGVYAIAKFKDGGWQHIYMSKEEVDAIRARSKSANKGPWVTDYSEMAKKTALRRLFKYLPINIEVAQQVANDESTARYNVNGKPEDIDDALEIDFSIAPTDISELEEVDA